MLQGMGKGPFFFYPAGLGELLRLGGHRKKERRVGNNFAAALKGSKPLEVGRGVTQLSVGIDHRFL